MFSRLSSKSAPRGQHRFWLALSVLTICMAFVSCSLFGGKRSQLSPSRGASLGNLEVDADGSSASLEAPSVAKSLDSPIVQAVDLVPLAEQHRRIAHVLTGRVLQGAEPGTPLPDPKSFESTGDYARALVDHDKFLDVVRLYLESLTQTTAATEVDTDTVAFAMSRSKVFPSVLWYSPGNPGYQSSPVDVAFGLNNSECTDYGFENASIELGLKIVRERRPFSDLFNANEYLVNPCSARSLGVLDNVNFDDPKSSRSFAPATLKAHLDGKAESALQPYEHVGILSDFAFLKRFPSPGANQNRSRSRAVLEKMLGIRITTLIPPEPDKIASILATGNIVMDDPSCSHCHRILDPIAQAFKDYSGDQYVFRGGAEFFGNTYGPGLFTQPFAQDKVTESDSGVHESKVLKWLAQRVIDDPRFAKAIGRSVWKFLLGEDPLLVLASDPWRSVVSEDFDFAVTTFRESNYDLRALAVAIVTSRRSLGHRVLWKTANNPEVVATAQTRSRFLVPELLVLRLRSLLGSKVFGPELETTLVRDLRAPLGGLDHLAHVDPISSANVFYSLAYQRVALETACRATVKAAVDADGLPPMLLQLNELIVAGSDDPGVWKVQLAAWSVGLAQELRVRTAEQHAPLQDEAVGLISKLLDPAQSLQLGTPEKIQSEFGCASDSEIQKLRLLSDQNRKRAAVSAALLAYGLLDPRAHTDDFAR